MKLLMIMTLLLFGCGKEEPDLTSLQQEIISNQEDMKVNTMGTLLYLTFSGIDIRSNKKKMIRINFSKLKDFSMHSPLVINFDKEAQDLLKEKILNWDEFKISFKFSSNTEKKSVTLNILNHRIIKKIDFYSNLTFELTEKDKEHLWSSINPIDLTFISRTKDILTKNLSLKSGVVSLGKEKLQPFTTYFVDQISCSIKHSKYIVSNGNGGGVNKRLFQEDHNYTQESCTEFDNRLFWKSEVLKKFNLNSSKNIHTDSNEYSLHRHPLKTVNQVNVRKRQYIDKDHINWFNLNLTWFE